MTKLLVEELRELSESLYLDKQSAVFDEIISNCREIATKGGYRYSQELDNNISNEEIIILEKKLKAEGLVYYRRTERVPRTKKKWYQRECDIEHDVNTYIHINWLLEYKDNIGYHFV